MRQMKNSGVEWIGRVPVEWNMKKGKYLYSVQAGYPFNSDHFTLDYGFPLIRIRDITSGEIGTYYRGEYSDDYIIRKGDCIIGMDGDFNARIWDNEDALLNQRCCRIVPHDSILLKWIYYSLPYNLKSINDLAYSTTVKHLSNRDLLEMSVAYPTLDEQHIRVDYLDSKCSQIDSIIEKQESIIEKLKEYKNAFISEIISNATGVKCNLGLISHMKNGLNYEFSNEGEHIKILSVADFKDNYFIQSKDMFSDVLLDETVPDEYLLRNKDIIFVRSNGSKEMVGRAVMVDNIDYRLTYSGFCIRLRNIREDVIDTEYLLYYFRSPMFRAELEKYSQGSNINNISQVLLSNISIVIPSVKYQRFAIDTIKVTLDKINQMILEIEAVVRRLNDYKKSLIYEVVTGKKEVCAV